MTAPSTTPSPAMPATSDATVVAQLDAVSGMVDSVLKANAAQLGGARIAVAYEASGQGLFSTMS